MFKNVWNSITKVKDLIYIVAFIITVATFFVNEGKNRQKQEDLIKRMDNVEKLLQEQLILNGKIIMYMQLDQENNH